MGIQGNTLKQNSGICTTAQSAAPGAYKTKLQRTPCHKSDSLFDRILRRIFPDQRKNERHVEPPLAGHLGMAHNSKPYQVADVSISGFSLLTDERWEPGTEMPITLCRTDLPEGTAAESFTVQATVVRRGAHEVAFSIALVEEESQAVYGNPLHVRWVTRAEMQDFLNRLKEPLAVKRGAQEESRVSTAAAGKPGFKTAFEGGD